MWLSQQSCVLYSNFAALDHIPFWYWNEPFLPKLQGFLSLEIGKGTFSHCPCHHFVTFPSFNECIHPSPLMFWVLWIRCSDPVEDFDSNVRPSLQLSMELRLWQLMWPTTNRQKNGRHWSCGWRKVCRMVVEIYWGAAVVVNMWWFDDQFVVFGGEFAPKELSILPTKITRCFSLHNQLFACGDLLLELLRMRIPLESWGFLQIGLTNINQWNNVIGWWSNICEKCWPGRFQQFLLPPRKVQNLRMFFKNLVGNMSHFLWRGTYSWTNRCFK